MCAGRGLVYVNRDKSSHIVKCNGSVFVWHRYSPSHRITSPIAVKHWRQHHPGKHTKVSTVFPFILKVISKFSCEFTNNQIGEWVCALNAWRTINAFPAKFPRYCTQKRTQTDCAFETAVVVCSENNETRSFLAYFSHRRPKIHFNMLWLAFERNLLHRNRAWTAFIRLRGGIHWWFKLCSRARNKIDSKKLFAKCVCRIGSVYIRYNELF